MSTSELANAPIEITLGGKKLKIARLSISELFTPAETKIKQDYINNSLEFAKGLSGSEKTEFLKDARNSVPKGEELRNLATDYMGSPVGVSEILMLGLNKHQIVTEQEVSELLMNSDAAELDLIKSYLEGDTADKKKLRELKEKEVVPQLKVVPSP